MAQPPIKKGALDYGDTPNKVVTLDASDRLPDADGSLLRDLDAAEVVGPLSQATIDGSDITGTIDGTKITGTIPNATIDGSDVTGTVLNATNASTALSADSVEWADVQNKPGTFTPSAHVHDAADITTGTINVARLGSGATGSNFLRGDNTWQTIDTTPPANSVGDAEIDWTLSGASSFVLNSGTTWTPANGLYIFASVSVDGGVATVQVNGGGGGWQNASGNFFMTDGTNVRVQESASGNCTIFYRKLA